MVKLPVKETKLIEEGKHTGKIMDIDSRDKPYRYTDYIIDMGDGISVKYGVPTDISVDEKGNPMGKHAKLLKELGLLEKDNVETDKAIGMHVTFMTINETSDKGTFARVVDGSVKKE